MRIPIALCVVPSHNACLPYTLAEVRGMCPQNYDTMDNPDSHTTTYTTPQSNQPSKCDLFFLPHVPAATPSPPVLHPFPLYFLPTHSTLNPSFTLRLLPRNPLPRAASEKDPLHYPARVEFLIWSSTGPQTLRAWHVPVSYQNGILTPLAPTQQLADAQPTDA